MFESDNISEFGEYLKILRLSLGFTQKDVQKLSGLNTDSLRKIENGDVLPRYDTIFHLSMVYKKDLLDDLRMYSNSLGFFNYYTRLENLIVSYDTDTLQSLNSDFITFMENEKKDSFFDSRILEQFKKLLSGISKYSTHENGEDCLNDFINSMRVTNPLFKVDNFHHLKYNVFELRILLLIALSLVRQKQFTHSNSILIYILEKSNVDKRATTNEKLLIIKTFYNLSYNFHRLKSHHKTLEYTQKGIDYCNENYLSYALAHLYYRKGIAEFLTNQPNYIKSLEQSIYLLTMTKQEELAKRFLDITYKSYNITIPDTLNLNS